MLYTYVKQNYNFTDEDKREALKMVDKIMEMAETTRKEGILGLERFIPTFENLYLRKGTELVVDGVHEKDIEEIFSNYIIFDSHTNKEMLELLIIREGILLIQKGFNPNYICQRLASFFGKDFIDEAGNDYKKRVAERINVYYQKLKDGTKDYPKGTNLLENMFKKMDGFGIQTLMREINESDVMFSIIGSSAEVVEIFFNNMSKRNADQIVDSITNINMPYFYDNPAQIIEAQNRILSKLSELEEKWQTK